MPPVAATPRAEAAVERLHVSTFRIPTDRPESDGTLEWNSTTLVVVEIGAASRVGLGYTYADASTGVFIDDVLRPVLEGQDAMALPAVHQRMVQRVRNHGWPGVAAMAVSAVDVALWDLKAKLLNLPLATLLGRARPWVEVYGSGGFTSYSQAELERQLTGWVEAGARRVKIKVGRSPQEDIRRAGWARTAIGPDVELFVDANGAYTRKEALGFAERFRDLGVTWFEEPVSSDDLEGLRLLRDRAPGGMDIAAGEYGYRPVYFRRMLEAGAVDVLQADATRCGGITGFLAVAALCDAFGVPLSAHTAPALHLPVCCAAPRVAHLEYFHDHARIESLLFDGAVPLRHGRLEPDLSRPGLGLELVRRVASGYR